MENGDLLKFIPFSSNIDHSFWHKLSELKLDIDKLNEVDHNIWGYFSNQEPPELNNCLNVSCDAFNEQPCQIQLRVRGTIINKNTIEGFKECDKIQLINDRGSQFMDVLKTQAIEEPYLINNYFIVCFADLKKYHYYYWFCFPAVNELINNLISLDSVDNVFSSDDICKLTEGYLELPVTQKSFFAFVKNDDKYEVRWLKDVLADYDCSKEVYWCFCDPSSDEGYPGWPLRNYLQFLTLHCQNITSQPVKIISVKVLITNKLSLSLMSKVWTIQIQQTVGDTVEASWVGWERNERRKMGPRLANLSHTMDPIKLSETSVNLNLKLMKWQIAPDLNLDIIRQTKCLLLGAGTLGCSVARNLLSWGVRHITFVDKGNVSYSNPVRQNLFKFEDSVGRGKQKAQTAATALTEIFPGVTTFGVAMSIPMPGHPVGEQLVVETTKSILELESLIDMHDVVFLLMDSRESRWLPTVIAAANNKLVINAALGFDSYLVMRHGVVSEDTTTKLGCYFCNDVTAPGNSSKSRTLDQQCTVTRPGVSAIAAALAVELLVSVLQSPQAAAAPSDQTECTLGLIPHSIRGFLPEYTVLLPTTEAFGCCIACSIKVLDEYKKDGVSFIMKVLESKDYLENLTGLTKLHQDLESAEVLVLSDYEDMEDD